MLHCKNRNTLKIAFQLHKYPTKRQKIFFRDQQNRYYRHLLSIHSQARDWSTFYQHRKVVGIMKYQLIFDIMRKFAEYIFRCFNYLSYVRENKICYVQNTLVRGLFHNIGVPHIQLEPLNL